MNKRTDPVKAAGPDASEKRPENFGPVSYANWNDFNRGFPAQRGDETPLYSDSYVVGEVAVGWGPFQVLHMLANPFRSGCRPILCLRTMWHLRPATPTVDISESDNTNYHGGRAEDEVAALIGLAMNIRLRAGGKTRDINVESKDERPISEDPAFVPLFLCGPNGATVIRSSRTSITITADTLDKYSCLSPEAATALVRAARLFQNGLWLSESAANMSWLMFVSAIEVAAVFWRDESGDPEKLLRELEPEWAERLDKTGDTTVTADMGKKWRRLLRSTARFLDFVMKYMPEPPSVRPEFQQVDWSRENLRNAMKQIYNYRSASLHSGIPFPAPMCQPPFPIGGPDGPPTERDLALAVKTMGGVWVKDDLPMHLHVFAHIVQGALMNWWNDLKAGRGTAAV